MNMRNDGTRVKLIFNPKSGEKSDSPTQLTNIVDQLQASGFIPETFLIKPECNLEAAVKDAVGRGIELFVVCGGDGTVSSAAIELCRKNAVLGIIPTGTQNNVAYSLGIPDDVPSAVRLLRTGNRTKVDMGYAVCGEKELPFLEVCCAGLLSTVFSSADAIQHGNLLKIGDFLTELFKTRPSRIRLVLDHEHEISTEGHMVLAANMPFVIRHFQVGPVTAFQDGLLDVLLFADMSKLDLVGYAVNGPDAETGDSRLRHFRVRSAEIMTDPAVPVMADGVSMGEGRVSIAVRESALSVITARPASRGGKTG